VRSAVKAGVETAVSTGVRSVVKVEEIEGKPGKK
jgi:hypothetical protein